MSNRIPYRDMVAHPNKVKYENADPNSHSKAIFRIFWPQIKDFLFLQIPSVVSHYGQGPHVLL